MILSLDQLMIDVEVFRLCRRAHQGISGDEDRWLEDVIASVGPGGNFLAQRSTKNAIRAGEWYISRLGVHDTYEKWEELGKPDLLDEVRAKIGQILAEHVPMPLDEAAIRELERIEQRARETG